MRSRVRGSVFGVLLFAAASAQGVTNEPDGSQIPRDSKNGEEQLYTFFQSRNDPVDWLADAQSTPSTFSPLCNFQATFVLHQAGSNNGVAWYNVDPNATVAPTGADLHVVVPAGSAVGTVVTSASIKSDPAYKGGQIGFALLGSQPHYSEQKWNVVCALCSTSAPWILSLTYASKTTPDAYYLAFEDGTVSAFGFGNDGDFNDDVFFFEGLTCQGGGTSCTTSQPGICAPGLTVCSASGVTCEPIARPGVEKCNGVDDDCNGQTDEGDGLCPTGFVCDRGTCVESCGGGEFVCEGKACNSDGFCVDPACKTVTCDQGSVCVAGVCKAPCDGISCPVPTICRVGVCVDPCVGVECATGSVCSQGVCVPGCGCNPCPTGTACDPTTELCIDPTCIGIPCTGTTRCVSGVCVDPCASAVCPEGNACTDGVCVASADAGTTGQGGSAGFDGGNFTGFGSGNTNGGGSVSIGGDTGTGAVNGVGKGRSAAAPSLTCGCRTAGGTNRGSAPVLLTAAFVLAFGLRRRR